MCVTGFLIFFVDGVLLQVIKYLVFKVCFLLLIIILALRCFFILYYPILYSPNSFILFESYFFPFDLIWGLYLKWYTLFQLHFITENSNCQPIFSNGAWQNDLLLLHCKYCKYCKYRKYCKILYFSDWLRVSQSQIRRDWR